MGVTGRELAEVDAFRVTPRSAWAVVLTDVMQGLIMGLGVIVLLPLTLYQAYVFTDGKNPLERHWSEEADQWRRRMLELFDRR